MKICCKRNDTFLTVVHSSLKIGIVSKFIAVIVCLAIIDISSTQGQPTDSGSPEKWSESNLKLNNFLPQPYIVIPGPGKTDIDNPLLLSYRLNPSGSDFPINDDPVFTASVSGNNKADSGENTFAFDTRTRFYRNEGSFCGGIHCYAFCKLPLLPFAPLLPNALSPNILSIKKDIS